MQETYRQSEIEKPVLEAATEKINSLLAASKKSDTNVLFLLSGGSSLSLLPGISALNLGPNITVSVLDERFSADPTINNMAQVAGTEFFKTAQNAGAGVIDTRLNGSESQDQLASRFNNALIKWMHENPNGKIIATVGMGPDGHVSGIMPFPEDPEKFKVLFDDHDESNLVIAYDASGKNPYAKRVTTTMNLLRKIDSAIVYISGESKREAFDKLLASDGSISQTPARILKEIKGDTFIFTDL